CGAVAAVVHAPVVDREAVTRPRVTLDRQVVGRDAVAIDDGVTIHEGDAVADFQIVSQIKRQIGTVTCDDDIFVGIAEVDRAAGSYIGTAGFTSHTHVPALADIGQRLLDVGVVVALHGQTGRNGVRFRVVARRSTQCCRYAGACG